MLLTRPVPIVVLLAFVIAVPVTAAAIEARMPQSSRVCTPVWKEVPSPAAAEGVLRAVSVVGRNRAWAVGYDRTSPLIELWDGARWRIVPGPRLRGGLLDVASAGPTEAWAVGWTGVRAGNWIDSPESGPPSDPEDPSGLPEVSRPISALLEHWDGRGWKRVPLPERGSLARVSAASSGDVWAVGSRVFHWNGKRWSPVTNAALAGSGLSLRDVVALSARSVWVVGGDDQGPVAIHWDGRAWPRFDLHGWPRGAVRCKGPAVAELVGASSDRDVWVAGNAEGEAQDHATRDSLALEWSELVRLPE